MILARTCIIDMDAFIVFAVILEFLVHFVREALSFFHRMLSLPILRDLLQALLRWVLRQRESCICWINHWSFKVHILLSMVIDSFYSNIVNIYSFLLEVGCHKLSVLLDLKLLN